MKFELTISAGERPQTYALDHVATGTGKRQKYVNKIITEGKQTSNNIPVVVLLFWG
jgi:hypothetical protein